MLSTILAASQLQVWLAVPLRVPRESFEGPKGDASAGSRPERSFFRLTGRTKEFGLFVYVDF